MGIKYEKIKKILQTERLLCDGAFGTYYAAKYDTRDLPEQANINQPERVAEIHSEYIAAGARLIRTNTFASNTAVMRRDWQTVESNIREGFSIAEKAAKSFGGEVFVAADIGQIPFSTATEKAAAVSEYIDISRVFLDEGAEIFVFETFSDMEDIRPAIEFIGNKAFVIVQFAVDQYGYSTAGLSAKKLMKKAMECEFIDAAGFNCGVGPAHMQQLIKHLGLPVQKPVTAFPNAGYPQSASNRSTFPDPKENIRYFARKLCDIAQEGVSVIGGCCGTTPEHIKFMRAFLEKNADTMAAPLFSAACGQISTVYKRPVNVADNSFFAGKGNKKLIAVELAPPFGVDDEKIMDAAHMLKMSGVDVLTFPDSPSGRTRVDSVLMAEKVSRETDMCVMPHICCRDKNAIAMRSLLLGAHINGIHNILAITGDPVPTTARSLIKSVFNFDSVGLMQMINDMNEEQFAENPLCFGGAINQTRRNIEYEIERVKQKMKYGASFFLTQPVCSLQGIERLRRIKRETGARILCGIMPFVSLKNALFIRNEMTGIEVSDEILARYSADMTREEGEKVGITHAREIMTMTADFADGYYFSFPFNRVEMLSRILAEK